MRKALWICVAITLASCGGDDGTSASPAQDTTDASLDAEPTVESDALSVADSPSDSPSDSAGDTSAEPDAGTPPDVTNDDTGDVSGPVDCAGVPGGAAYEDECGSCDADPANDCMQGLEYYGTVVPLDMTPVPTPDTYTLFEPNTNFHGGLDGLDHEPTAEQGAGKLIFNRVWRASKHGVDRYEQYGLYHWWLGSYGNNSIEGGLWVNPKVTGPHYYPSLHIAGIGDMYHACNDVQFGSGLYERILGDRWLTMIQFSNRILFVPGVNIAFDKDQPDHAEDDGIWVGWGWTSLELDHPSGYKFWLSVVETYDEQGPVNGYLPEHFNWIDPEKVEEGSYAQKKEQENPFGTFATHGSKPNYGLANEQYLNGLDLGDGLFYVPVPMMPSAKDREYIVSNAQSVTSPDMQAYSAQLADPQASPLIPSSYIEFSGLYQSTHSRLKVTENIAGEEHLTVILPPYTVGYEDYRAFIDWDVVVPEGVAPKGEDKGYMYFQKQDEKWQVEGGASDSYKEHPHIYTSTMAPAPDEVQRVPAVESRYFNYQERDPTHPDFANWDTSGMTRHEVTLQNGSVATYAWFKFTEQPAMKTAQQNWPDVYTPAYLATLQEKVEALHAKVAAHSKVNPSDPVFINYRHENEPTLDDPNLARVDPAQRVQPPEGMKAGYVPVIISVYHPEERSFNDTGLVGAPAPECSNTAWTDTYHPYIDSPPED